MFFKPLAAAENAAQNRRVLTVLLGVVALLVVLSVITVLVKQ